MAVKISTKNNKTSISKGKKQVEVVDNGGATEQAHEDTPQQVSTKGLIKQDPSIKKGSSKSFLMKGKDAQKALEKEDEKSAQDAELRLPVRTFWLRAEGSSTITFLDGDLDPETGMLNIPMMYNHNVYNANMGQKGERIDLVCLADSDEAPCPICEYDKHALVGLLTVVEHVEYESGDGDTVINPRRLFMPKRTTLRDLQEAATELGGLRGAQFKVRRTGKRKATVGDEFEFVGKLTQEQMEDNFPEPDALDYEESLVHLTADEMYQKGVVDGVKNGLNQPTGGYDNGSSSTYAGTAPSSVQPPKKSGLPSNLDEEL